MPASEQTSPLETVDPNEISVLFNKDPDLITTKDADKIVAAFRAKRFEWAQEDAKPKAPRGKRAAPKAVEGPKPKVNVDLNDLEL